VEVMPETTTGEYAPDGLASGMATETLLSKRRGNPGTPVISRSLAVINFWSVLTCRIKSIGVPQIKEGDVLILNGTLFVADEFAGMSG
jgi:hypothetical protein